MPPRPSRLSTGYRPIRDGESSVGVGPVSVRGLGVAPSVGGLRDTGGGTVSTPTWNAVPHFGHFARRPTCSALTTNIARHCGFGQPTDGDDDDIRPGSWPKAAQRPTV